MEEPVKNTIKALDDLFQEERADLDEKLKTLIEMLPDLPNHHIMTKDLVWLKMDISNRLIKRKNGFRGKRIRLKENKVDILRSVMENEIRTYTEKERKIFLEGKTAIEEEIIGMWSEQVEWLTRMYWNLNMVQTQMKSYHDSSILERKYPLT